MEYSNDLIVRGKALFNEIASKLNIATTTNQNIAAVFGKNIAANQEASKSLLDLGETLNLSTPAVSLANIITNQESSGITLKDIIGQNQERTQKLV